MNEGHSSLLTLELLSRFKRPIEDVWDEKLVWDTERVKDLCVFTTHTPVPAGHDVIPFYLMEKYFHTYWPALGLDRDAFLQLGIHPEQPLAGFNLTAFALRMSGYCNGVSKRHGEVSRRMWQSLWPNASESKVPLDHETSFRYPYRS